MIWVDVKRAEALAAAPDGLQNPRGWDEWITGMAIRPGVEVVVYDARRQLDAARLWWLLSCLGVDRVSLIEGGFPPWVNQGRLVTAAVPYASPSTFKVAFRKARLATREDVIDVLQPRSARIVDARSDAEHTGERAMSERGGRIRGA